MESLLSSILQRSSTTLLTFAPTSRASLLPSALSLESQCGLGGLSVRDSAILHGRRRVPLHCHLSLLQSRSAHGRIYVVPIARRPILWLGDGIHCVPFIVDHVLYLQKTAFHDGEREERQDEDGLHGRDEQPGLSVCPPHSPLFPGNLKQMRTQQYP